MSTSSPTYSPSEDWISDGEFYAFLIVGLILWALALLLFAYVVLKVLL